MNARNVQRKILRVKRLVRAFTLVEMLICVGAVALIAVGLGKLFSSTGDTVRIGRRLSYLNEMATTIENRIRRDLAAATRDGPMIIRHKMATSNGAGVLLSPDDRNQSPKVRPIDEITFLANGHYTTNREPQWPGRSPSSSVARIYLGHGMVRNAVDSVKTPNLTDDPANAASTAWPTDFGAPDTNGGRGPNQFAGDWILLRHVTVLARPQTTLTGSLPTAVGGQVLPANLTTINWADSPSQIDLQPAAPSVFRFDPKNLNEPDRLGHGYESRLNTSLTSVTAAPLPPPTINQWLRNNDAQVGWPQTAGGLVDIASIDPPMIRNRILGLPHRLPFDASYNAQVPPKMTLMTSTAQAAFESNNYDTVNPIHYQKMMMAAMLPGADPWIYQTGVMATPTGPLSGGNQREQRVICAPKPPNFSGTLRASPAGTGWNVDEPYRQQDQAMLSASNLIVGCSSFKIEWSFGDVYPLFDQSTPNALQYTGAAPRVGQIIWHGRLTGDSNAGEMPTEPYRGERTHNTNSRFDAYTTRWTRSNGQPGTHIVPGRMIHWPVSQVDVGAEPLPDEIPFYSFFGYIDPTFTPAKVNGVQVDPDTIDWPWPKLLRFTIGLTDPADPTYEQTYQFIVEVPAANRRQ